MSDAAKDRARIWFKDPEGWSRSVASDVLALEASVEGLNTRVAALEASRQATPDSSPAADGEWRMLEVGEVIQSGDQAGTDVIPVWTAVCLSVGSTVHDGDFGCFRRRVKPATPATDVEALRAECDRLRETVKLFREDNEGWVQTYRGELAKRAALEDRCTTLRGERDAATVERLRLLTENAALREERDEWELRCSVNKDTADKLAELRDRILFDNAALRRQIAAPIDVEAFRPEFERVLKDFDCSAARHHLGPYEWIYSNLAWCAVNAFADRLNAARKEVGGE